MDRDCTHIIAPQGKKLVWYLSMEEYLALQLNEMSKPLFFTWVVPPTVIFGRHQVLEDEVNTQYCTSHGVQMYRRKSGGGCVYSDNGNLMLSYITPNIHSDQVFQEYLDKVAEILTTIGFAATKTEHNDVLIGTHKVSGNACYALPRGTIVHGTMLYDVDFEALQQAITPSHEKLSKHGVQSVRQRVVNLKDLVQHKEYQSNMQQQEALQSIDLLAKYFTNCFCETIRSLTAQEMEAIDQIEQSYLDTAFIYSK